MVKMEKGANSSNGLSTWDKKSSSNSGHDVAHSMKLHSTEAFLSKGFMTGTNLDRPFDGGTAAGGGGPTGSTLGGANEEMLSNINRDDVAAYGASSSSCDAAANLAKSSSCNSSTNLQPFDMFPPAYSTAPFKSPGGMAATVGFPFTSAPLAVGLLADLPERDAGLTRQMMDEGAFQMFISRIRMVRKGETRGSRFMTPYLEGLVKVLARVTFALSEESGAALALCREHNLASLFIDLLQSNGLDNVQMVSAMALENLSSESRNLTRLPEIPSPGFFASVFSCLSKPPIITGLCKVHRGTCSLQETFCLLEGPAVDRLVALLDHNNNMVVEAALVALSTLLDDEVDVDEGVQVLLDAEGIKPILDVLLEKQTDSLQRRAVWTVERLLRNTEIACEVSGDPTISTALVDAFQHGDYMTRQIAERALKHVDKIPNFSGIFPNLG